MGREQLTPEDKRNLIRHFFLPTGSCGLVFALLCLAIWHFPLCSLATIGTLLLVGTLRGHALDRKDLARGWRVGHTGRDYMFYDERHNSRWRRILIPGDMLIGKAHHIIYFRQIEFPRWAEERRDEIVQRIKSQFAPPKYEYKE